ncbi:MAG: S8 family serine peptidase, partial [Betaproteobacteria bacterium]|nr:S8 family serine peptidase [Betaproteobacteria bacterium]
MERETEYFVLRRSRRGLRDVFAGAAAARRADGVPGLEVQVEGLTRQDLSKVAAEAGILGLAPIMPFKLVAPLNVTAAPAAAANVEWGIRAVGADTSTFDGSGVAVAVLDTGIDNTHPAFAGVNLVERDFTGSGNGDAHGHGTHCAGTVFGRDVGGRRIGVARGVTKAMIGKVLGPNGGSSEKIAEAILWAVDQGAKVISMSLGIDFPGAVAQWSTSMPIELATSKALEGYRANVLLFERLGAYVRAGGLVGDWAMFVAAAGNESQRNVNSSFEIAVSPP